jgi:hypothetical protein
MATPSCAAQSSGEEGVLAQLLLPSDAWHLVLSKLTLKDVSSLFFSSLSSFPSFSLSPLGVSLHLCRYLLFLWSRQYREGERVQEKQKNNNDTNKPFRSSPLSPLSLRL